MPSVSKCWNVKCISTLCALNANKDAWLRFYIQPFTADLRKHGHSWLVNVCFCRTQARLLECEKVGEVCREGKMTRQFLFFFLSVCKTHLRRSQSVSWRLPVSEQMIQKTAAGSVGNRVMTVASEIIFFFWVAGQVHSLAAKCGFLSESMLKWING